MVTGVDSTCGKAPGKLCSMRVFLAGSGQVSAVHFFWVHPLCAEHKEASVELAFGGNIAVVHHRMDIFLHSVACVPSPPPTSYQPYRPSPYFWETPPTVDTNINYRCTTSALLLLVGRSFLPLKLWHRKKKEIAQGPGLSVGLADRNEPFRSFMSTSTAVQHSSLAGCGSM